MRYYDADYWRNVEVLLRKRQETVDILYRVRAKANPILWWSP